MDIEIKEKQHTGKVFVGDEKNTKAEMAYTRSDENLITVKHTAVCDELKGEGMGRKLLDQLAEKARNENFKIKAECSYVQHIFGKYGEYNDIQTK
jgi:predicted GNAT family acetyltransferase